MHRLLAQQIKEATRPDGELDLGKLLAAVGGCYIRTDEERRGIVRSMQLMSDEATAPGLPNFTGAFVGVACQDMSGAALHADFDYFEYVEREFDPSGTG